MSSIGLTALLKGDREKLIQRLLESTPAGRAMVKEFDDERVDERRRLISDLEKLNSESSAKLAEIAAEFSAAQAEKEAAQSALFAAGNRVANAMSRYQRLDNGFSRARLRLVGRLEATADPQVHQFMQWLEDEQSSCRRGRFDPNFPIAAADKVRRKLVTRVGSLDAAQEEARKLLLSPLSQEEMRKEIDRIRESLPEDPGGVVGDVRAYEPRRS